MTAKRSDRQARAQKVFLREGPAAAIHGGLGGGGRGPVAACRHHASRPSASTVAALPRRDGRRLRMTCPLTMRSWTSVSRVLKVRLRFRGVSGGGGKCLFRSGEYCSGETTACSQFSCAVRISSRTSFDALYAALKSITRRSAASVIRMSPLSADRSCTPCSTRLPTPYLGLY
jgi:hypothetical protein